MSASTYRMHLENYLKTLDVSCGSVVDVGGGSNPVSGRVKSWNVKNYQIIDNELEEAKGEVTFNFDMNKPLTVEDATEFDQIFCLELFDYIWNPVQACTNLRWLALPGTKLTITFPFIYPNHNPVEFDMLRFTKQGAVKLLQESGFAVDKVIPRLMNNTGEWKHFMELEGYRHRGAVEAGTLFDAGYIIEAYAV